MSLFEMIDPDDRADLLNEPPAILAARLMTGLSSAAGLVIYFLIAKAVLGI